ncbi:hypothetical protein Hdeb2414_s0043g00741451 [Helianthus debilis subsp. tardiflorus]
MMLGASGSSDWNTFGIICILVGQLGWYCETKIYISLFCIASSKFAAMAVYPLCSNYKVEPRNDCIGSC